MAKLPEPPNTGLPIELVQLAELRDKVKDLERKAAKHALLIESMWTFMKAEFELQDEDLKTMFDTLDMADGVRDGQKKAAAVTRCPKCEEPVKGVRTSCFWCGHEFPGSLFDA